MNAATHDAAADRPASSSRHPRAPRNRTPAPTQPPQNMGMSPTSRYNHNLKVLRRRDPSIISIFDQFSHVCVYHHNGMKWEKQGFEGSMFLYERESYPPYGFYILNRMGMEDYIHRLYPEDDIGAHASYLMIRSYPDFTTERLNAVDSSHETPPDKFSDVYLVPNLDKLGYNDKGRSQTVGLWMFATDAREPMIDVMLRLHSYIKKNLPYPEEFRYGPGRPPPPNPNSRRSNRVDTSPTKSIQSPDPTSENDSVASYEDVFSPSPDGLSDLDKLFMKLQPPSAPSPVNSVSATHNIISSTAIPPVPQSTSKMTVDSLFAVLSGPDSNQSSSLQPPTITTNTKATCLLNSIFASATPSSTNTLPTNINSPAPTTTSSGPQVLSQDVLSNLLGFPPSRSASVVSASSAYSSNAPSMLSARSHPSSREGDDEEDSDAGRNDDAESLITSASERGPSRRSRRIGSRTGQYTSDGGHFELSNVLNAEAALDAIQRGASRSGMRPSLGQATELLRGNPQTAIGRNSHEQGDTNGDVTPRPPLPTSMHSSLLRMSSTSRLQGTARIQRGGEKADGRASVPPTAPPVELSLSTSTVRAAPISTRANQADERQPNGSAESGANGPKHRPLVPFSADSELWPYPLRPSSSDLSTSGGENGDDGEILELDFEETSALSDMNAFKKAMRKGKERSHGTSANAGVSSAGSGAEGFDVNGRGKGRKKTRKEKEAEKREQIENSWDTPVPVSNPPPAVPLGLGMARSPTPSRKDKVVNGAISHPHQTKKPPVVNGNLGTAVDSEIVKDSLIGTLSGCSQKPGRLEKNAFVREVLTLVHTDKSFVETLWRDYLDRLDA